MNTFPNDNKRCAQVLLVSAILASSGMSGVATAQMPTGVTLYGVLDIGVGFIRGNDRKRTGMMEGSIYGPGSRWGLRVTEDLGGGLKAGAVLESGFFVTTGAPAQGGRLFGRQVFLTLSSEQYGEIRMGRQYAFHETNMAEMNSTANTLVLNPAHPYSHNSGGGGFFGHMIDAPRLDNTVQLISPRFYGMQMHAMYGFSGNGGATTLQDIYRGIRLNYHDGPLNISATVENNSARVTLPGKSSTVNKLLMLGGSYDFTVLRLFAGYQRAKDLQGRTLPNADSRIGVFTTNIPGLTGGVKDLRAFTTGASIPVGPVTYAVTLTHTRFKDPNGKSLDIGRYGAAATYNLSRRTAVYTAFAFSGGDLKSVVNERRLGQIGMTHRF